MLKMSTEDGRFSNTWRGACSKSFLSNLYFTLRVWRILVGGLGSCWDLADKSDIEWDFECITEVDLLSMGNSMADDGHIQIFLLCKLWKGWGVDNNLIMLRILLKMKIGESIYRCINLWSTWSFLKLRGIIYHNISCPNMRQALHFCHRLFEVSEMWENWGTSAFSALQLWSSPRLSHLGPSSHHQLRFYIQHYTALTCCNAWNILTNILIMLDIYIYIVILLPSGYTFLGAKYPEEAVMSVVLPWLS